MPRASQTPTPDQPPAAGDPQPVTGQQKISRMCLVCGTDNDLSLNTQFLELADGRLCALFETRPEHQSYPGRVHGGIISALIDETAGRVIQISQPQAFGVTIELNVKFRAPVPVGQRLRCIAWMTKCTPRIFEGEGQVLLANGQVAAQGTARYLRLPVESIAPGGLDESDWFADTRNWPDSVDI